MRDVKKNRTGVAAFDALSADARVVRAYDKDGLVYVELVRGFSGGTEAHGAHGADLGTGWWASRPPS
jgi:hypothetical protein